MNRFSFSVGLVALCAVGCGQGEGEPQTFEPGPAGRAAGLVAVVTVDGEEIRSNEIEIVLRGGEAHDPDTPRVAPLHRPVARWTNHDGDDTLALPAQIPARYEALLDVQAPLEPLASCEGAEAGDEVTEMPTLDGTICYTSFTYAIGTLAQEEAATVVVWFGPDGMYVHGEFDLRTYFPPDFVHAGVSTGVGCVVTPDGGPLTKAYIDELTSLGVSFNAGPVSAGYTFYGIRGKGFQRVIQYDTGLTASASLLPYFPLGMTVEETTVKSSPLRVLTGWHDGCAAPRLRDDDNTVLLARHGNALTAASANLDGLAAAPVEGYRGALRAEIGRSFGPVAAMLAHPTGTPTAEGIPAASNADWFGEFLARPGETLCSDCPSTSVDGILGDLQRRINEAEDTADLFAAGAAAVEAGNQGMPELVRQAALQTDVIAGVDLALELAEDIAAERRGDPHRYVAPTLHRIEVDVGAEAVLDVTAEEIGALIGVDAAALEGATVIYDAEPHVERAAFAIEDGVSVARMTPSRATKLLTRVTVDLSTAAGPLPEGAEDWTVRPAMRLLLPKAGPVTAAYLGAPGAIASGAPATLSATLLDEDNNVVRDGARVTFYDAEQALGSAETVDGTATLRVAPTPAQPEIEAVDPVTLTFADGTEAPGIKVEGVAFSRDADIIVDGGRVDPDRIAVSFESSQRLLLEAEPFAAGSHTIRIVNPGGLGSAEVPFER